MARISFARSWMFVVSVLALAVVVSSRQYPNREGYVAYFLYGRQDEPGSLQCEAPCELDNTCGSSFCTPAQKRDLSLDAAGVSSYYNESDTTFSSQTFEHFISRRFLEKRQFDKLNPGGRGRINTQKIGTYVKIQNRPGPKDTRDPQFRDTPDGFFSGTSATVQKMAALGDEKLQWGTNGLHGCTMLAIISKRGVYMAHFWETFTTRETDSLDGDLRTQWQQRVLDAMEGRKVNNPYNPPPRKSDEKEFPYEPPIGDPVDWSLFTQDGDNTIATFMTPLALGASEDSKDIKYPQKIGLVADLIRSHVPGVQVIYSPYKRLDYNVPADVAQIDKSQRGMCLFQYDGIKDWRLFWEAKIKDSLGSRYEDGNNIEKRFRQILSSKL